MRAFVRWSPFVLLLLGWFTASPVAAHVTKLSSARLEVREATVAGTLEVDAADLRAATGAVPGLADADYLLSRIRVTQGGVRCEGRIPGQAEKGEHRVFDVRWHCPPVGGTLRYEASLFQEIDPASRHMVTAKGDVSRLALLSVHQRTVELAERPMDWSAVLARYFEAGLEHILIGFDHLAFLVAAMAWGRRLWPLVRIVTGFTIAHSITLACAALGIVSLPSAWVEIAIAASIVFVAVENFAAPDLARRGWVTFGFGLVHGFGFASVLHDFGLPENALVPALAAFNVGVEAGQIAVVLVVLAGLTSLERKALRRSPFQGPDARVVKTVSALTAVLGAFWFVERVTAL